MRAYRTGAKALPCQSRAGDDYSWVAPKPCGRWLWLGRAKAVRTMTMAGSRQSRADDDYGWVAPKPCGRADEQTGQEAEAKMGVILALRRYRSGS